MTNTGFAVEFATSEPDRLARWWAHVLGWTVDTGDPGDAGRPGGTGNVVHPAGPGVPLRFVASAREKTGKNGVHLALRSASHEEQQEALLRLFNAGARFADVGQDEDVPWVVLTDPSGNELYLLEPRRCAVDTGVVHSVVVDAADPERSAEEWISAGLAVVRREPDCVALHSVADRGPYLEFQRGGSPAGMLRVVRC